MVWPTDGKSTKTTAAKPRGVTVVFVHQFGGRRSSTRRHQDLVLALGYDTYAYTLRTVDQQFAPFRADLVRTWAAELNTVLDAIPGNKVIYSLSFPSMAVACLLGERDRADVRAWICDGGPFRHVLRCMWNYFAQEAADQPAPLRAVRTVASYAAVGGPLYGAHAERWVSRLRSNLPILSLRAGRDRLVPAAAIDRVFGANSKLNLKTVAFPGAGHLDAVRIAGTEYALTVERFLDDVR